MATIRSELKTFAELTEGKCKCVSSSVMTLNFLVARKTFYVCLAVSDGNLGKISDKKIEKLTVFAQVIV